MLGGWLAVVFVWAGKGQLGATKQRQVGVTGLGREGKGVKREGERDTRLKELLGPTGYVN